MNNSDNFLITEYKMCFEQMRFYDTRNNNLLKYLFTLTTTVATAQFAVYKINQSINEEFYIAQSFLSIIVFTASVLLYLSMLKNRIYFVHVVRQINSIRNFSLENELDNNNKKVFKDFKNRLYICDDFPALKYFSIHTFQLVGASLICGLYAGSLIYGIAGLSGKTNLGTSITVCILLSLLLIFLGALYLHHKGKLPADSIHLRP